jgi:hypothetical protein
MPCEALDAPENLPKETRRQVALRQLEDEVPGMANEPPAGLEEPLLQACREANYCPREVSNPPRCSQGDTELDGHQNSLTAKFETQAGLLLALGSSDQNAVCVNFVPTSCVPKRQKGIDDHEAR